MTSIPAEFYALANAFLFALHNILSKKALRHSNPATAVISGLLINIIFLWGLSVLFVPLSSLTSASILIFAVVGLFQPGLTRLLSYKGIDALGVAVTDPIRATTPLFSAMMAIIFLGEKLTLPIVFATLMIIAGITLLSWRNGSMKLAGSAVFLWYPIAASALAGATQVVRKFGLAAVPHPFLAAAVTATSSFIVSILDSLVCRKESRNLEDEPTVFLVVSRRRYNHQFRHGVHLLCVGFRQGFGGDPDRQHRPVLLIDPRCPFLRDVERVTLRIVLSAAMIVGGVVLLTLWK